MPGCFAHTAAVRRGAVRTLARRADYAEILAAGKNRVTHRCNLSVNRHLLKVAAFAASEGPVSCHNFNLLLNYEFHSGHAICVLLSWSVSWHKLSHMCLVSIHGSDIN